MSVIITVGSEEETINTWKNTLVLLDGTESESETLCDHMVT